MASPLLFSICAYLILYVLRQRFVLSGQVKAVSAVDWSIAASVVLLPVVTMTALLMVAPGYLQSLVVGNIAGGAGRWSLGGAIFLQIAVNFSIKKIIDFSVKRIVDSKV
jgi:Flp pilus assembly protein TadB